MINFFKKEQIINFEFLLLTWEGKIIIFMSISQNIKKFREYKNLTQYQITELIQMHLPNLRLIPEKHAKL